jgi:hypothetical protein
MDFTIPILSPLTSIIDEERFFIRHYYSFKFWPPGNILQKKSSAPDDWTRKEMHIMIFVLSTSMPCNPPTVTI